MYFFTVFDVTGVVILSRITGSGDFLEAAHSVAAWETLYRIGLLCGLVGTLSTVLLAIGLYVTLKTVDGNLAIAALIFRLAETVIGAAVIVGGFATLQIYLDASHAGAFDANQLAVLADLASRSATIGTEVSVIFFSLGSATFFYLFLRSGYIPQLLAMWGLLGSLLCFAAFVAALLVPHSAEVLTGIGALPIGIAEPVVGFWLLVWGIKKQAQRSPVAGLA